MKEPRFVFHPILIAAQTPLTIYALNFFFFQAQDVILPLTYSILGAIALWVIAGLIFRNVAAGAIFASICTYGFFSYGELHTLAIRVQIDDGAHSQIGVFNTLWALLFLVPAIWLSIRKQSRYNITIFLNVVSVFFLCYSIFGIAQKAISAGKKEAVAAKSSLPLETKAPAAPPDVYYIILDGHGRADVLEREFKLSQENFEKELEERGFYVAKNAHSNYCQTELSLSSSLNMSPIETFGDMGTDAPTIRAGLDGLISQSEVSRQFKKLGYEYLAITTGFPALKFDSADLWLTGKGMKSLYLETLLEKTPIQESQGERETMFEQRKNALLAAFENLGSLAGSKQKPRFVVVHILAPHPPFVFDKDGNFLRPKGHFAYSDGSHYMVSGGNPESYTEGYKGQVQYIDKLVLETIDKLQAGRGPKPIILIQGDHGPKLHLDQGSLPLTDVNEVFPILSAYSGPDEFKKALYQNITPINSFRTLLRSVYGGKIENLPDDSFYSTWEKPLDFTKVTDKLKPRDSGG